MSVLARLSWLGIARESLSGVPALPVAAIPADLGGYEPEDTVGWVMDQGLRSSMGSVAGVVQGTLSSALMFGGSCYPDSLGWWLDNLLGDHSAASAGTLGTAQLLALPVSAGDTQLTAAASLGSVAKGSVIQISDGLASEIVIASAATSGTTVQFAGTPARFAHGFTATAALETASAGYSHVFSALNGGSGQPVTHTLTDTTGLTAGTGARCYPCATIAQLDLAGDPGRGLVTAKVTGAAWPSQPSAAVTPYPAAAPYVVPFAGWQSTVLVGGVLPFAGAWQVAIKRPLVIYRGAQNGQYPVVIARGGLEVTGALDYPDPSDETPLSQMTSGAQPSVQVAITNGASSMTVTSAASQFTKAKPDRERIALAYGTTWQAIDNLANAGGSGGIGPVQVSVTNAVPAY